MEHKQYYCDFCNNEVKSIRNGFNELYIELWNISVNKIRLSLTENCFAPDKPIKGQICKKCLSNLPQRKLSEINKK